LNFKLLTVILFLFSLISTVFAGEKNKITEPLGSSQFILMDDAVKLHVVNWGGEGVHLIFLAGLSLNAHTFDFLAQSFTSTFQVIGVTRAGHGLSDPRTKDFSIARQVKDIVRVLDRLNIERAVFVGHSIAGAELTYLGKHFPKRVKGLIYLDALQDLDYVGSHVAACPDNGYTKIDLTEHKEHFYKTQRSISNDGSYMPFADLNTLGELLKAEAEYDRDYTDIKAPALAINHIPEQTRDFFFGMFQPSQSCIEEINKLTYLGIANFIKNKANADVAAIQNSQHMIHMANPDKLTEIMHNWLVRNVIESEE
jgi:pimeloyl-ACP methyl ester carboxylesterase